MSVQPVSPVKAPAPRPCGSSCIGVGYLSDATVMLELNSVGFVGSVNLSLSDLPAGDPSATDPHGGCVGLNVGDQPVNQVVPVGLYTSWPVFCPVRINSA